MRVIPPKCEEELVVEEIREPIPGFYLEHKNPHPAFHKERKGLVVMVHGGPHSCSEPFLTFVRYMFLRWGYAVLLPNYIGSAGYGQHQVEGLLGKVGKQDAR
jgi:acylaminoacyl-peptidase